MAIKIERDFLTKTLIHFIRDERNFRNINLDREMVAHHLGISCPLLSKLIHEELHTTFKALVNKYRVQYAHRLLLSSANTSSSLDEIAIRAGFSNRMTMHRAFLSYYGKSPGAIRVK